MKRLSNISAIVMGLLMAFSLTIPIHAQSMTGEEMAQVLYDLGLFDGVSTSEFVPNLEGATNREQAAKMVVVALGLAIVEGQVSAYTDVSLWAEPYVAIAVSEGFTNGISPTAFGAQGSITRRQLTTWFDRVLTGSTTAWADNIDLDNVEGLTRGDLVILTYKALQEVPLGSDESLIESIVGTDEGLRNIAISGGLIDQSTQSNLGGTTSPYIRTVSIVDDNVITITMSNELDIDTAEDMAYYKLYSGAGKLDDPFESISLSQGNQVTITFDAPLSGNYIISIDGVLDTKGNEVDAYESFLVGSSRGIFAIEVRSDYKIVVTFTVNLEDDSVENSKYYEVTDDDGDALDIERIRWSDNNEVTITLEDALRRGNAYTLAVIGLDADSGGDLSDSETFFAKETIKSVEVTGFREITVTFSEDVEEDSAENHKHYTLKDDQGKEYEIEDLDLKDEDEVTITYEDYLDEGTYKLEVSDVEDINGNDIEDEIDFTID